MTLGKAVEPRLSTFSPDIVKLGSPAAPEPLLRSRSRAVIFLALIVLFWAAIYIPGLFRPALLDDADTVHAEAAREMLTRHDWVTLYANGVRYLEKAPLQYWAVALSYKLFGVSEWSTRLPLTLAALLLAVVLYRVGSWVYGPRAGFYAALIMVTSFGPFIYTRFFIPDLIVGLLLTAALGFFLAGLCQPQPSRLACWSLAVCVALMVLAKGLIGVVFPGAVIFLYLLLTKNLRHLLRMRLASSALIFLAIAAPWHILAAHANPPVGKAKGFLWFYFVNEHFRRYIGTRYPKDYDTVPLWLFWGLLLIWLLPWSAFLPQSFARVRQAWKAAGKSSGKDSQPGLVLEPTATLLFTLWAAVIMLFFSFSTRQEYYVLPALPALALLTGAWLGRESQAGGPQKSGLISSWILFAISCAVFVATMFLGTMSSQPAPGYDIADLLRRDPSRYALSFGHFLDLTPQALGAFRVPLMGTGLALLLGSAASLFFRKRYKPFMANLCLAGMMVGLLACALQGFTIFEPVISSKQLALAVEKQYRPGDVIVINGEYEEGSTMNFYTGLQVHVLKATHNLWYGSLFPDAPPIFENEQSFAKLWNSPTRVFLWTEAENVPDMLHDVVSFQVARCGGKVILSNQPNRPH